MSMVLSISLLAALASTAGGWRHAQHGMQGLSLEVQRHASFVETQSSLGRVTMLSPDMLGMSPANFSLYVLQEDQWSVPGGHYCRLPVCQLHDLHAPRMYTNLRGSGSGFQLMTLMNSLALADKGGMNFGGLVADARLLKTIHPDAPLFDDLVVRLLGEGYAGPRGVFVPRDSTMADLGFRNMSFVTQTAPDGEPGAPAKRFEGNHPLGLIYQRRAVRMMLQESFFRAPFSSGSPRPLVVFHVRRGDLPRDHHQVLVSSNEYFYRMAELVRQELPSADFHVFSETSRDRGWTASDFDGFRERGMRVHLDEVGLEEAWRWMAHADVFVQSQHSYFSEAAGVLNPKCVVALDSRGRPTMGSAMAPSKAPVFADDLAGCIRSRVLHQL